MTKTDIPETFEMSAEQAEGKRKLYSEEEINAILKRFKAQPAEFIEKSKTPISDLYNFAIDTLLALQLEQAIDVSRFNKVRELYKEVNLENTLKLLIRCKLAYEQKRKLLNVLIDFVTFSKQSEKVVQELVIWTKHMNEEQREVVKKCYDELCTTAGELQRQLLESAGGADRKDSLNETMKSAQTSTTPNKKTEKLLFNGYPLMRGITETCDDIAEAIQVAEAVLSGDLRDSNELASGRVDEELDEDDEEERKDSQADLQRPAGSSEAPRQILQSQGDKAGQQDELQNIRKSRIEDSAEVMITGGQGSNSEKRVNEDIEHEEGAHDLQMVSNGRNDGVYSQGSEEHRMQHQQEPYFGGSTGIHKNNNQIQVVENQTPQGHDQQMSMNHAKKMNNTVHGGFFKQKSPQQVNNYLDGPGGSPRMNQKKTKLKKRTKSNKRRTGPPQHLFNNTFYQDIQPSMQTATPKNAALPGMGAHQARIGGGTYYDQGFFQGDQNTPQMVAMDQSRRHMRMALSRKLNLPNFRHGKEVYDLHGRPIFQSDKKPPVPSFGHSESARQRHADAMNASRNVMNQTHAPPSFERGQGSGGGFWEGTQKRAMRKTDGFPRHKSVNPRSGKNCSTLEPLSQRSHFPEISGPSLDMQRPINALEKPGQNPRGARQSDQSVTNIAAASIQQPDSFRRLSPPLSAYPPDLYRKGDSKQSSVFKTRLSPIRQELLRNQPMNTVGLEAQRTLAQRIAILDYKGSLAGGSMGHRSNLLGKSEYETNPVMAKIQEKLLLREFFKEDIRQIERICEDESQMKSVKQSSVNGSPERVPCTLLEESVTESLKKKTRERSRTRSPVSRTSPNTQRGPEKYAELNVDTSSISQIPQTERANQPERLENKFALEDDSFQQLSAYVSQKNHGVAAVGPLALEQKRSMLNKSPQGKRYFDTQRTSRAESHTPSASATMYLGNHKSDAFTNQFTSVWLTSNEFMYRDTRISSDIDRRDREARGLVYRLEKQEEKERKKFEKQTKELLIKYYQDAYGVQISEQQRFILSPKRLRDLCLKKATTCIWNKAAKKIQKWWRGRLGRHAFLKEIRTSVAAVSTIQRAWRWYRTFYLRPRVKWQIKTTACELIQKVMHGYRARRASLKAKANHQCQLLYDEWHRIDLIMRGNLQRRIRRAWLAKKARIAEKKRLKKEREEANKKKFGKKKKSSAPAPTATPPAAKPPPSQGSASPAKKPVDPKAATMSPMAKVLDVKAGDGDPLSQTMVNIQLSQSLAPDGLELRKMQTEDMSGTDGGMMRADTEIFDEDGNPIQIAPAELGEEAEGDIDKAAELETIKEGNDEEGGENATVAGEDGGEGAGEDDEE